jgi:glycosyltransferase involved in cell wall biosynthesis
MSVTAGHRVDGRSSAAARAAHRRHGTLFLLTQGAEPCAVEIFTRKLVAALAARAPDKDYAVAELSGRLRDIPSLLRRVARAEGVVFNLPLVSWKRMLATPILVLVVAAALRCRVSVVMHEWSALHWLRRLLFVPFLWLARSVIVISPFVRAQIAASRWIPRAARKFCLVPHPPTILRSRERLVTARVEAVRQVARDADLVIGSFGAIYKGKASDALLDVCDHLRKRGIRALVVFAGSFTKSLDDYERAFRAKVAGLGLETQVIVTGYVESEAELYALFEEIGAFLFLFPEGLTARRSSVIACLQSERPVVVTAPQSRDEFAHHAGFKALIEAGALSFVAPDADAGAIANVLVAAARRGRQPMPAIDDEAWWAATTAATEAAL